MDFALRPASAAEFPAIRALIQEVGINRTGLDWRRFVVAVDDSGAMLGCAQLKPHGGGVVELASIAVQTGHRQRGIARALIEHLLSRAPRPLYLTCRSSLGSFYEKWGFRTITRVEMPVYFQRLSLVAAAVFGLFVRDEHLLVMRLQ